MVQDSTSRKLDQYIVRFPDGMRERLKSEAAKNRRSLNAEIIDRLENSFTADEYEESYANRALDDGEIEEIARIVLMLKEQGLGDFPRKKARKKKPT